MFAFSNDPFKPLTEVERAFARAKLQEREDVKPFVLPEGAREQLSTVPEHCGPRYIHRAPVREGAVYSEEFMRRLSGTCCSQTDRCDDFAKQLNLNLRIISAYWVISVSYCCGQGRRPPNPSSPVSRSR
jgi:hypothetical protein